MDMPQVETAVGRLKKKFKAVETAKVAYEDATAAAQEETVALYDLLGGTEAVRAMRGANIPTEE